MIKLIPMISQEEIQAKVKELGQKISNDYKDKNLVLVGILKGSFIFLADLARNISINHGIDLIGASSYDGTQTTGHIKFTKTPDIDLAGKDILIVEDIIDTGRTLSAITTHMKKLNPATVKICSLINKKERRQIEIDVHYSCFEILQGFIVGYGLDYNENYRSLPAIYDLILG